MTLKDLERVLYFENFVVTDPLLSPLKEKQLLSEDEFYNAQDEYGEDAFVALIGAEALKDMLAKLDLDQEKIKCRDELRETGSEAKRKKLVKRLKIIEAFQESGSRPEWRSEEHTSELQSLMRISYAVFCLKKKKQTNKDNK